MEALKGGIGTRHPVPYTLTRPNGLPNYVLLMLRSRGKFTLNGKEYIGERHYAVLIPPKTPYSYTGIDDVYSDDWLHFHLEAGESIPEEVILNKPFPISDFETCSSLIHQILWELYYTDDRFLADNIRALFSVLINHLSAACLEQEHTGTDGLYSEILRDMRFRMKHSLSESPSIQRYAKELGISESHFRHIYSTQFGISFQNDLIHMRINYAQFLLQTTDFSMEKIAEECGYSNEVHFFRQFKRQTGITPARYRKSFHAVTIFEKTDVHVDRS
ncbi:MAG: AraC family transcriptional regulator [Schwartzia sp.]|nr:AraC family transcriptional regulator [Schwartzia sp. (in: firmicutes)]